MFWYVVVAVDGFGLLRFIARYAHHKTIETKYYETEDFDIRLGLIVESSKNF